MNVVILIGRLTKDPELKRQVAIWYIAGLQLP